MYTQRGYFHQNCMWMCLPHLENLTFSIPIFRTITHLSVYHIRRKSTQVCSNWVLFTTICSKYIQFYIIWAPSFLMKTHRSLYQISRNSTPKGRHINVSYTMSVWGTPLPPDARRSKNFKTDFVRVKFKNTLQVLDFVNCQKNKI